jgi:hypothetical protein
MCSNISVVVNSHGAAIANPGAAGTTRTAVERR